MVGTARIETISRERKSGEGSIVVALILLSIVFGGLIGYVVGYRNGSTHLAETCLGIFDVIDIHELNINLNETTLANDMIEMVENRFNITEKDNVLDT